MIENLKKLCRLVCIPALIGILLFPVQIMAEALENGCSVVLPVSVAVEGQKSTAGSNLEFEFEIRAEEPGSPMPETDMIRIQTVDGKGSGAFAVMNYQVPGEYRYQIVQIKGTQKNLQYDENVYEVMVRIINDDRGGLTSEIWAVKNGMLDKTDQILFTNRLLPVSTPTAKPTSTPKPTNTPKPTATVIPVRRNNSGGTTTTTVVSHSVKTVKSPKTGDNTPLEVFAGILLLSGVTAAAVIVLRKKQKR
ncbi:Spy0128 family protein [Blautia sp. MSJ-19]|uniref:Spy0128 family protein n=1 Tax=Blautia sp. MSJ-19 TaxID=2841517 RepID=UPI001C0E9D41|nr:FctA domain-containing protein [Blautia sp. MSJ-19]MBU5479800.1 LPXTG cell wall anchor domain-containing protein [Blautia sp. MSJ-19]